MRSLYTPCCPPLPTFDARARARSYRLGTWRINQDTLADNGQLPRKVLENGIIRYVRRSRVLSTPNFPRHRLPVKIPARTSAALFDQLLNYLSRGLSLPDEAHTSLSLVLCPDVNIIKKCQIRNKSRARECDIPRIPSRVTILPRRLSRSRERSAVPAESVARSRTGARDTFVYYT